MGTRLTRCVLPFVTLGIVGAGIAAAAPSAGTVTVKSTMVTSLGAKVLVTSNGLTLYHYVPETKGSIRCTGACAKEWPPLLVAASAKPLAGTGLTASKLSTIRRPDGKLQVAYGGLPLYRYLDDEKPGQAKGQGEGGVWYAITPAGKVTKAVAKTTGAGAGSDDSAAAGGAGAAGGGAEPAAPAAPCPAGVVMDPGPCYNY